MKKNGGGVSPKRVFIVPDLHCPYHDPKAVSLAKQLFDAFRADTTIFIGDNRDFIWASRFFVPIEDRNGAVVRELRSWNAVSGLFKSTRTLHLRGNHEARILKYLDDHPELKGLEGLDPKTTYPGLVKNDYILLANGSFVVTHGSFVRASPGASAAAELKKWGKSGCSGHSHRLCRYYQRDHFSVKVWLECGHLAVNPPHYRKMNDPACANWHQGVVVLYIEGNQFHAEEIPFTLHYKAFLNGVKYAA